MLCGHMFTVESSQSDGMGLKRRPKNEDRRPKTLWSKTKTHWSKTKTLWSQTKTHWFETKTHRPKACFFFQGKTLLS